MSPHIIQSYSLTLILNHMEMEKLKVGKFSSTFMTSEVVNV